MQGASGSLSQSLSCPSFLLKRIWEVWDLKFRVQGSGYFGLGLRFWRRGVSGLGFGVWDFWLGLGVWESLISINRFLG